MVTAAAPTRLPHAVQAGPAPAAIWLTLQALSLTVAVATPLLLPVAGRHLSWQKGVLFPDYSLAVGILVACGVWVALSVLRRTLRSALAMRVPGALGSALTGDVPPKRTHVPDLAAALGIAVAETAAVLYAATHADGDHGVTALFLTIGGVYLVAATGVRALAGLTKKRAGWGGDIATLVAKQLLPGVVMVVSGVWIAPRGEVTSPTVIASVVVLVVVVEAVLMFAVWTFRRGPGASGPGGVQDLAEVVSDSVLSRTSLAPTLGQRKRGTRFARAGIYLVFALAALAFIGFSLT